MTENYYASSDLAGILSKERDMYRTLKLSKKDIPKELLMDKKIAFLLSVIYNPEMIEVHPIKMRSERIQK